MKYVSIISAILIAVGVSFAQAQTDQLAVKPGWKPISECGRWQKSAADLEVTKKILPLIKRPADTKLSAVGSWSYPLDITYEDCVYTVKAVFPTTNKYGVRIRGSYKATATLDKNTGHWTVKILELNQGGMFE